MFGVVDGGWWTLVARAGDERRGPHLRGALYSTCYLNRPDEVAVQFFSPLGT